MDINTLALPSLWLLLLGSLHGINPAMGWLFAVSLGLQEEDRRAVWRALGPLAAGHLLAVGAVVALAALAGLVIPPSVLKWSVAALLLAFGVWHLRGHHHPGGGGMRVGARDLTLWSFLMASAHGAGLMVLPFVISAVEAARPGAEVGVGAGMGAGAGVHHGHGATAALQATGLPPEWALGIGGTALHTAGYLLVSGLVAFVVYEWLGLRLLRTAWINLDVIWAASLVLTAVLTVVV